MDGRQVIDFEVKPWTEPFLIYRAELLEDVEAAETKNRQDGGSSDDVLSLILTGFHPAACVGNRVKTSIKMIDYPDEKLWRSSSKA